MTNIRKVHKWTIIGLATPALVVYFLLKFGYLEMFDPYDLRNFIRPFIIFALGTTLSLVYLLMFGEGVVQKWVRHIGWWYLMLTFIIFLQINPLGGGILYISRSTAFMYLFSLLFAITLVYAPIMHRRLKKGDLGAASK